MTPDESRDAELLVRLRAMWDAGDPAPADLTTRMVFAARLEQIEAELLELDSEQLELAGARGEDPARTLTFSSESTSIMVTISALTGRRHRLDGWVAPARPGRLELRGPAGQSRAADVGPDGRFVVDGLPAGLWQLTYHPADGGRSVAAPAISL